MNDNYDHPLVIIDMQNYFFKRNKEQMDLIKERVKKVCKLCKLWMKRGLPIILVEYNLEDEGLEKPSDDLTVYAIRRVINKYPHVTRVEKDRDDGSNELIKEFDKMKVAPKELHICGVNLAFCVADTISGMFHRKNDVKVNLYKDVAFNVRDIDNETFKNDSYEKIKRAASHFNGKLEIHECPIPA